MHSPSQLKNRQKNLNVRKENKRNKTTKNENID